MTGNNVLIGKWIHMPWDSLDLFGRDTQSLSHSRWGLFCWAIRYQSLSARPPNKYAVYRIFVYMTVEVMTVALPYLILRSLTPLHKTRKRWGDDDARRSLSGLFYLYKGNSCCYPTVTAQRIRCLLLSHRCSPFQNVLSKLETCVWEKKRSRALLLCKSLCVCTYLWSPFQAVLLFPWTTLTMADKSALCKWPCVSDVRVFVQK